MDTSQAQELMRKYAEGKCSADEQALLESWYNYQSRENAFPKAEPDFDALYLRLVNSLPAGQIPMKKIWLERKLKIAVGIAAAVTAIALCIYFFSAPRDLDDSKNLVNYTNDIAPGKTGATLTLANGNTIDVSATTAGKLAEASGVVISKGADGQIVYKIKEAKDGAIEYNTLETSNGEQVKLILPDQSSVFLNAASKITFPSNFSKLKERRINLSGEGYFEVSKDASHPFIVETVNQEVRVLGTHFNISAYQNEQAVKTTLIEGSVKINKDQILKPGQLAVNTAGKISISQANLPMETAWTRNDFHFDEEPSESVMLKVARWYNITVSFADDNLKTIPLSGYISRTRTLSTVLERIGKAANLRFVVTGQHVTVHKL